jgi:RNA polymerase sigma-70 factor, ECF subfamily
VPARPDSAALDAWVAETAPRALAYARSLLRNPADAEDIVQDCYCRLLAKAGQYDLIADGLKLLMRSITNASINARTRRRNWFPLFGRDDGPAEDPPDARVLPVESRLEFAELGEAVKAGLAALPVNQRAAVELKALGHSQQEIAEILSTTPTNAGVLIHRGRTALADYLKPFLAVEGDDA